MRLRGRRGPVYHRPPRQVKKNVNRALVSSVILFGLFIAVGVAYTFFMGKSTPTAAIAERQPAPALNLPMPVSPPANAPVGVAVESFTSLAYPGTPTSLSVRTNPGATCKIEVLYNNTPSGEAGLSPKIADDFGTVSWDWTVSPAAPQGMWPVNITCASKTKSGVVQAMLDVSSP